MPAQRPNLLSLLICGACLLILFGCGDGSGDLPAQGAGGRTRAASTPGARDEGLEPAAIEDDIRSDIAAGTEEETSDGYDEFQADLRKQLAAVQPDLARFEVVTAGDFSVATVDGLVEALASAAPGQTVFVEAGATFDLTGREPLLLREGVTLASDRGRNGSTGAMLFTNDPGATLVVARRGARVVGLDVMGPDPERRLYQVRRLTQQGGVELFRALPASTGFRVVGDGVEIENCEIWGFSHAGVEFTEGTRGGVVRHCLIHHNQRRGLGYGVSLDAAEALIEVNVFDWCRHCVAGTGRPGTGYEARYNFVLRHANGHSFDMHGGSDRGDGTEIAGSWAKIHHNIIAVDTYPGVVIRGVPLDRVEIYSNKFTAPDLDRAIHLKQPSERIELRDNLFNATVLRDTSASRP